jgi:hypothetical protein
MLRSTNPCPWCPGVGSLADDTWVPHAPMLPELHAAAGDGSAELVVARMSATCHILHIPGTGPRTSPGRLCFGCLALLDQSIQLPVEGPLTGQLPL